MPACAAKRPRCTRAGTACRFFVRWPKGQLGNPRDIPVPTHGTDVLPTLISLCGTDAPEAFDGVSLCGLLRGEEALADRMFVVQYGHIVPTGNRTTRKGNAAVIWNRWRLVDDVELYDLDDDPGQERNVAKQHPEVVQKMRMHYEAWWDEVGENLGNYFPIAIGSHAEIPRDCPVAIGWGSIATIPRACAGP